VSADPPIAVADDPERQRYEVRVGDEVAGFAQYRARPGLIAFTHTEVDERFEGRGLGRRLISFALDDARGRGLAVLPFCPFVNGYIQRHREYADLVPADRRAAFDL
jgi:predicted GNAT family acetyltransferase